MYTYDDLVKQGHQCVKNNQVGMALQKFREAAVLKPDEQEPLIQMALLFEHLGDAAGKIQLLEKAAALDETSAYAVFLLGLSYYSVGDYEKAAHRLRRGVQLVERGTTAARTLLEAEGRENAGLILNQLGSLDETAQLARELLQEIEQSHQVSLGPQHATTSRRPIRIGVLMALWQRHLLSNVVMNRYLEIKKSLDGEVELVLWAVGSEGANSRRAAESNGFKYVEHPNMPLGAKWNAGLKAMRDTDVDAVVIVGSDDILNEQYFTKQAELLEQGCVFSGLQDMYVLDLRTLRLAYWPGYDAHSGRRGESIGLGRCFHRTLLDEVDWSLWDDQLENALDRSAFQRISTHLRAGRKTALLNGRQEGIVALDVKSGENIWSLDDVVGSVEGIEYLGAAEFLHAHLCRTIARDLLSLSDEARHIARLLNDRDEVPHIVTPERPFAAAS